jgi:transcriptional regulator with XRE-family HTH domain
MSATTCRDCGGWVGNDVGHICLEPKNWLDRELPDPEDQRDYARERAKIVVTEAVAERMQAIGMKRVEVAAKIGKSKSHVTQLLSGRRNLTLRSLSDVLWALGMEMDDLVTSPLGGVPAPLSAPGATGEAEPPAPVDRSAEPKGTYAFTGKPADNFDTPGIRSPDDVRDRSAEGEGRDDKPWSDQFVRLTEAINQVREGVEKVNVVKGALLTLWRGPAPVSRPEPRTGGESHCADCCCAHSWEALGITEYTGKSIPGHITALRSRLADVVKERDALRQFAEAVVSPCEWGPSAIGCDDDATIADAAERCGIFREVKHSQPCEVAGCECDGSPTLLQFAWVGTPGGDRGT